jgi:hypothetical protein
MTTPTTQRGLTLVTFQFLFRALAGHTPRYVVIQIVNYRSSQTWQLMIYKVKSEGLDTR